MPTPNFDADLTRAEQQQQTEKIYETQLYLRTNILSPELAKSPPIRSGDHGHPGDGSQFVPTLTGNTETNPQWT